LVGGGVKEKKKQIEDQKRTFFYTRWNKSLYAMGKEWAQKQGKGQGRANAG